MSIALTQDATFRIAELIEHKQRVIALAAKVTVPGRLAINSLPAGNPAHHRVTGQPVRIVDIRVSRQPSEGGLA